MTAAIGFANPANETAFDLSPTALAVSADGKTLYVACASAARIVGVDIEKGQVSQIINLPFNPTGLTTLTDTQRLVVTGGETPGVVAWLDLEKGKIIRSLPVGSGPCAPVFDAPNRRLYVCLRWANQIAVIDTVLFTQRNVIPVERQPVAAALAADVPLLLVANHLPAGPANIESVASGVSVVRTDRGIVATNIVLPNGSTALRGLAISPDGHLAAVTHQLARFKVPTTHIERGWMNTSAMSLIDLKTFQVLRTVILDDPGLGAANPWAILWTPDGQRLGVSHAGTHELSLINARGLLDRAARRISVDLPEDLSFLRGLRQRLPLPGKGPRALALLGNQIFVAEYFSDTVSVVDLAQNRVTATLGLGPEHRPDERRLGERLFHDATLCYQQWQSCASCHPEGRVDGLNWDLTNDGIGNPKNTKSLLLVHRTPPMMSLGIRETASRAVRSGLKNILFAVRPENEAAAIEEYLKSMRPIPSPFLVKGQLSASARRGEKLFQDQQVGCSTCHPPPWFTDLKQHDVGTRATTDHAQDRFDTPTLMECWRTSPYLHDGSATTLQAVLTAHNRLDRHGRTTQLTPNQIEDLAAFVLSQ